MEKQLKGTTLYKCRVCETTKPEGLLKKCTNDKGISTYRCPTCGSKNGMYKLG